MKNAYVFVCAAPDGKAMYFSRRKKGHEGVKGTPVEDYLGIPVHDHEKTFYNYGAEHQECLAHVLRYLKESIADEGDRTILRKAKEEYEYIPASEYYKDGYKQ